MILNIILDVAHSDWLWFFQGGTGCTSMRRFTTGRKLLLLWNMHLLYDLAVGFLCLKVLNVIAHFVAVVSGSKEKL